MHKRHLQSRLSLHQNRPCCHKGIHAEHSPLFHRPATRLHWSSGVLLRRRRLRVLQAGVACRFSIAIVFATFLSHSEAHWPSQRHALREFAGKPSCRLVLLPAALPYCDPRISLSSLQHCRACMAAARYTVRLALCLQALPALLLVPAQAASCQISLSADAASSLLVLGGGAAGAPLAAAPPSAVIGLTGECSVLFSGNCPGDANEFVGSLVGATVDAPPGDPLTLFPSSIQVRPCGRRAGLAACTATAGHAHHNQSRTAPPSPRAPHAGHSRGPGHC